MNLGYKDNDNRAFTKTHRVFIYKLTHRVTQTTIGRKDLEYIDFVLLRFFATRCSALNDN